MRIDGKEFRLIKRHKSKLKAKITAQKFRLKGKQARVRKIITTDTKKVWWGVFIYPLGRK